MCSQGPGPLLVAGAGDNALPVRDGILDGRSAHDLAIDDDRNLLADGLPGRVSEPLGAFSGESEIDHPIWLKAAFLFDGDCPEHI